jgi:hypothetical protein
LNPEAAGHVHNHVRINIHEKRIRRAQSLIFRDHFAFLEMSHCCARSGDLKVLGDGAFEKSVEEVASIEKALGI